MSDKHIAPEAVAVLARGGTMLEAAEAGGVSERTIRRHLAEDPLLREAVATMRDEMLAAATGKLTAAAALAVERMITIALESDDGSPSVRLRACESVLANASRFHGERMIEERLAELEELASVRWST